MKYSPYILKICSKVRREVQRNLGQHLDMPRGGGSYSWLNFTRPPYVPKFKNGIFRDIPKNRDIPFFGNFGMSHVFFLEYSKISYIPDFRKLVCPKIENGISQYSKLFQKSEVGYVPNIFWNIPYSKIARHVYVPDLKWNIPEYSNLFTDPKKIRFLYVHLNVLVYIPIVYFYSMFCEFFQFFTR